MSRRRHRDRREFAVAVWERGRFTSIESEHDEHHDAEVRAASLHAEVNEGQFRPRAMFVPVPTERFIERCGDLPTTDEFDDIGITRRRRR